MVEFTISKTRTDGMDRKDIGDGIYGGTLCLCPYWDLPVGEQDAVLDEFLKIGDYTPGEPRTMAVLELGTARDGVPCARIECVNKNGAATRFVPSVCEFCTRLDECAKGEHFAVEHDFWDDGDGDDE